MLLAPWLSLVFAAVLGGTVIGRRARRKPRVSCPQCGKSMPKGRLSTSASEWLSGGWTCSSCGCRIDRNGKIIAS